MHGPDGTDYPNKTIYYEVEEYKRLVYDHGGSDDRPPLFRVTATFAEVNGQTELDMSMSFATEDVAKEMKKFIKQASGDSTWDRLAEYLSEKDIFVINRSFNAPIETVFQMWTDPKHLAKWSGPAGSETEFIKADIMPGGVVFYRMDSIDTQIYGRSKYIEINKPNRITYTQQFVDEKENISRHPMAPTWPETMLTTLTLAKESENSTRLTLTWEPYGPATQEEIETFKNARSSMTAGWTGSFDKLEEYLKK